MFKCNHPNEEVPDTTHFRLRLLKFTTLYGKRLTPCETTPPPAELQALRRRNRKRADGFYTDSSDSSFQDSLLEQHIGKSEHRRSASRLRDSPESTSLADLVPMFIGLSAARSRLMKGGESGITETWMELAGEFMLQAALEQCLEYSSTSSLKLREIFSWGWRPSPTKYWEDEESVNEMFCDEDALREIQGWAEIRQKYIDLVGSPHTDSRYQTDNI